MNIYNKTKTIYEHLQQNQEALESSTDTEMFTHATWYHCLQVVHSTIKGHSCMYQLELAHP